MSIPLRQRSMTVTLLAALGVSCAGCATDGSFATLQGSRSAFEAPVIEIKGETPTDQKWIDKTEEAGIAAYGWKRPKPRPAALRKPAPVKATPKATFKQRWLTFHFRERAQK